MTREATIQDAIRAEAARRGVYLWRNNTGVLSDLTGRPVRFGLGNDSERLNRELKSSDLIGLTARGRFVAIECKSPGWVTPRGDRELAQERFINLVKGNGGIAGFCTSVEDFIQLMKGAA